MTRRGPNYSHDWLAFLEYPLYMGFCSELEVIDEPLSAQSKIFYSPMPENLHVITCPSITRLIDEDQLYFVYP